jgi:hypothetical protein
MPCEGKERRCAGQRLSSPRSTRRGPEDADLLGDQSAAAPQEASGSKCRNLGVPPRLIVLGCLRRSFQLVCLLRGGPASLSRSGLPCGPQPAGVERAEPSRPLGRAPRSAHLRPRARAGSACAPAARRRAAALASTSRRTRTIAADVTWRAASPASQGDAFLRLHLGRMPHFSSPSMRRAFTGRPTGAASS